MKINEVGEYIQECLRLLYWIYFKPYTLAKWTQDIDSNLNPDTNPFFLKSKFRQNYRLRRYANQTLWLTIIIPILAVFVVAPIYDLLFLNQSFLWRPRGLFLIGWIGGIWLSRINFIWRYQLLNILYICFGCIVVWNIASFVLPISTQQLIRHNLSPFIDNSSFILFFIFGIKGFFVLGLALGFTSTLTSGMATAVTLYLVFGIELSLELRLGFGLAFILGVFRVYFWIPELLWMLGLGLMVSQGRAASILRRLPPYFDQLIILPLPFMAEIIVEAYDQNPVATRSTIDYFITSTNQQAVAKKAMFGIGVKTLIQCRYISDIIGSQVQLDWLPTDDQTFGKALPRLIEISHDIDAAYQATTAYNKLELVDRSISNLEKLRTSVFTDLFTAAATSDTLLFCDITSRWLQILQDNRQALEVAAQGSAEIPNPYIAGNSLEPTLAKERFKGRQDLFRAIEEIALSVQPPVLLLYGRRRTGKTSALKYLASRVSSDLIPLLVDFQGTDIRLMENVAKLIAEAMIKTAKSSRNLTLPSIAPEQLSSDPFYALQTWMDLVELLVPNQRFLLCIDEFETLETVISTSGSYAPLNFLRHVTQNRRQWIVLFSGSHRLEELEPYWSNYLIGTRTMPITYLQEAEARELIQHPVSTFPDIYSSAAVDAIFALTRGHAYLVQLLCECVVVYVNSDKRKSVTVSDVEAAKSIAWERGAGYFIEFNTDLKPAQQDFIHRLLAHQLPQESDLIVIRQLIQAEIIEKDANGGYRFQVPLIEQYIREKSIL
jgi:uncharacterized protein